MTLVGSQDWQPGVVSAKKPISFNAVVSGSATLIPSTGNGIVVWNVDIIPTAAETGTLLVSATDPEYWFCQSMKSTEAHWWTTRGLYVPVGGEIDSSAQVTLSAEVVVSILYDQL